MLVLELALALVPHFLPLQPRLPQALLVLLALVIVVCVLVGPLTL